MTPEEYIKSLTVDEMRFALLQCWDWRNDNGCPMSEGGDDSFDCKKDFPQGWDEECDEDWRDQYGCWIMFYVWTCRKRRKAMEKLKEIREGVQDDKH